MKEKPRQKRPVISEDHANAVRVQTERGKGWFSALNCRSDANARLRRRRARIRTAGAALFLAGAAGFTGGCGGTAPTPVDTRYAQASDSARTAFDAGLMPQAVLLYQRALDRAEMMDDPALIGNSAYNLAAALWRRGNGADFSRARALLQESRSASRRAGSEVVAALLLEARVARSQGDRPAGGALVDEALADSHASRGDRMSAHLLKGELAADAQDAPLARTELDRARAEAGAATPRQRAGLAALSGRLALGGRHPLEAANEFDRQADFLQKADVFEEMAAARAAAGRAWLDAGRFPEAADRFYRAARSAAAAGREDDARQWCITARNLAEKLGDRALISQIDSISAEHNLATQPAAVSPGP